MVIQELIRKGFLILMKNGDLFECFEEPNYCKTTTIDRFEYKIDNKIRILIKPSEVKSLDLIYDYITDNEEFSEYRNVKRKNKENTKEVRQFIEMPEIKTDLDFGFVINVFMTMTDENGIYGMFNKDSLLDVVQQIKSVLSKELEKKHVIDIEINKRD